MKRWFLPFGLVALGTGCAFAARSPETYRDDTRTALEARSGAIQSCYDRVLETTPGAAGRVTVNFQVETEQGRVTQVSVDPTNTTAPPAVAACVTQNIEGASIHPPDQRTGLGTWVYDFSPPPASQT